LIDAMRFSWGGEEIEEANACRKRYIKTLPAMNEVETVADST